MGYEAEPADFGTVNKEKADFATDGAHRFSVH
jgi:hypothetical protein